MHQGAFNCLKAKQAGLTHAQEEEREEELQAGLHASFWLTASGWHSVVGGGPNCSRLLNA